MSRPRVQCSSCQGTKWDSTINSRCPDCQGIGNFEHWKADQDPRELESELNLSRTYLGMVKAELMDYVSGGRDQNSQEDQRDELARLRWERDYWAFRVQTLQGDLELSKGAVGGESVASGE